MADFFAFVLALALYIGGSILLGGIIWLPFKLIFNTPFQGTFCGIALLLEAILIVLIFVVKKKKT